MVVALPHETCDEFYQKPKCVLPRYLRLLVEKAQYMIISKNYLVGCGLTKKSSEQKASQPATQTIQPSSIQGSHRSKIRICTAHSASTLQILALILLDVTPIS